MCRRPEGGRIVILFAYISFQILECMECYNMYSLSEFALEKAH